MTIFADKVLESTTTVGTGTYALDGAPSGFKSFVEGFETGNTCAYYAANADGTIWELGLGTVTDATPDTLTRTKIYKSSSDDAKIDWGAGTKYIYSIPSGHILSALLTTNIGSTRPDWLEAGGQWIKNSVTPWEWYLYDGSDDILLWKIDTSTGAKTFTTATTFTENLTVQSDDDGSNTGPLITADRDSASPAENDAVGGFNASGRNSAGETVHYGRVQTVIKDPTDGSEDSEVLIDNMMGGTFRRAGTFGKGLYMPGATGGDPGSGKINSVGYQINGVDFDGTPPADSVGSSQLKETTAETTWALGRIAGASVGAVGTYALMLGPTAGGNDPGDTVAASGLDFTNAAGDVPATSNPSGTWRCMGVTRSTSTDARVSLFLRIS